MLDIQSATVEITREKKKDRRKKREEETKPHSKSIIIILTIIQYLYSALMSCKGYRGAVGFRLRVSEQVFLRCF